MFKVAHRTKWTPFIATVAILSAFSGTTTAGASGRSTALPQEGVAVEAVGFAPMMPDGRADQAHQEALLDARRNALIQAHVALEVETLVDEMQLSKQAVRSLAAGYVREMHVLEAGPMAGMEPPVYRVRVRAVVEPLCDVYAACLPATGAADRWQPVVELELHSDLGAGPESALRSELVAGLGRCGIAVVTEEERRAALSAVVTVSAGRQTGQTLTTVAWTVSVGKAAVGTEPEAPAHAFEHLVLSQPVAAESPSWQRLAVELAQDAVRLWASPRPTRLVFIGADEAQSRGIVEALAGCRIEKDSPVGIQAVVPAAGDPVQALEPLLARAGVDEIARPIQQSLTCVTYDLRPAAQPEAGGAGAESEAAP